MCSRESQAVTELPKDGQFQSFGFNQDDRSNKRILGQELAENPLTSFKN